ncbi:hypothetical protein QJS10_CPA09g01083 [Acorus calamus]|uniref:Uncharacterized protein n=1 Tax=Acorus calamus TaxID=4465 RepID=A0AAV9E626_ACOCL|nr:hypothetical protein QJS10_CPA09g01083 [Acorus calamus]
MCTAETTMHLLLETEADDQYENPSWKTVQPLSLSGMWSVLLPIAILISQSMLTIYRSLNDMRTVSFIVIVDVVIALLFCSIIGHEKSPVRSKQRKTCKILIWFLATLLNVGFAYRVTMMMPLVVSWVLWALVGVTTVGTFHLYFLRPDPTIVCNLHH